jgi:hypothetical protein
VTPSETASETASAIDRKRYGTPQTTCSFRSASKTKVAVLKLLPRGAEV